MRHTPPSRRRSGSTPHRYGVSGVRLVCGGGGPWLLVAWTRVVLCTPLGGLPLVCWPGFVRVSQFEDQSRTHPDQHFVHPMSTQVRGLDPDAAEGGPRSDPQIATHTETSQQTSGRPSGVLHKTIRICAMRGKEPLPPGLGPRETRDPRLASSLVPLAR